MSQVSLYLSDAEYEALRARASKAGVSLSKYTANLIAQDAASGGWPSGFWDLFGVIQDPNFEAIDDPVGSLEEGEQHAGSGGR